jgi:hypothetical protein
MKVICNALLTPEDKDFLTIGKEYLVLEVLMIENVVKYRINRDDGGTPVAFKAEQFDITDNKIPSSWIIDYTENNQLWIAPQRWLDDSLWQYSFWEDLLSDTSSEAEKVYQEEVQKMLEESERPKINN